MAKVNKSFILKSVALFLAAIIIPNVVIGDPLAAHTERLNISEMAPSSRWTGTEMPAVANQLYYKLFVKNNYNPYLRPKLKGNRNKPLELKLGLKLTQLLDVVS